DRRRCHPIHRALGGPIGDLVSGLCGADHSGPARLLGGAEDDLPIAPHTAYDHAAVRRAFSWWPSVIASNEPAMTARSKSYSSNGSPSFLLLRFSTPNRRLLCTSGTQMNESELSASWPVWVAVCDSSRTRM